MTRNRLIFYSIFGAYHVGAFIFTLIMEFSKSTSFLLGLLNYLSLFKWLTLIGVILIAVDFVWLRLDLGKQKKAEEGFRHENNVLKAKVYDMQEGAKPKPEVPKAN
jgi:hypothetical protein